MCIINKFIKAINKSNYCYITEFKDGKAKAITRNFSYYAESMLVNYRFYIPRVSTLYSRQKIHIVDENYELISDTGLWCKDIFDEKKFKEEGVLLVEDKKKSYLLNKHLDIIYEFNVGEEVKLKKEKV